MILASGMLVVSCQSNTYDEIAPAIEKPSYVKNFEPLLRTTCVGCHTEGSPNEALPYLTSYELTREATEKGSLICRIEGGDACGGLQAVMPPSGKLPQTTIDVIKLWKEQGYLKE